jgi:hypothetical protein
MNRTAYNPGIGEKVVNTLMGDQKPAPDKGDDERKALLQQLKMMQRFGKNWLILGYATAKYPTVFLDTGENGLAEISIEFGEIKPNISSGAYAEIDKNGAVVTYSISIESSDTGMWTPGDTDRIIPGNDGARQSECKGLLTELLRGCVERSVKATRDSSTDKNSPGF